MRRFIKGFVFLIGVACFVIGTAGVFWVIQSRDVQGTPVPQPIDLTKSVAAAGIQSLNVSSDVGMIVFKPAAGNEIKAHFTARIPEAQRESWTLTADTSANGSWNVVAASSKQTHLGFDFNQLMTAIVTRSFEAPIQLEITLPPQSYENIVVHTDTGRIELGDLQADLLDASTATGSIGVSSFKGKVLKLHTNTGKINFKDVSASGNVSAHTNTGRVEGSLSELASPVTMGTNTGAVTLHLPADSSAHFDLSANVGGIDVDTSGSISFEVKEKQHTIAKIGTGMHRVHLHADAGKVGVTAR